MKVTSKVDIPAILKTTENEEWWIYLIVIIWFSGKSPRATKDGIRSP